MTNECSWVVNEVFEGASTTFDRVWSTFECVFRAIVITSSRRS